MPQGIEIIGSGGNIILNQDFKVMQMVSKVSSTSVTSTLSGSNAYQRRTFTFSFPYTDCIYAVSQVPGTNTTPIIMSAGTPSGGTTTVTVSCFGGATVPVFEVFAFRVGGGGPVTSGAGIEVYNADGSLGFGSGYKPLRVLSQFDWRLDTANPGAPEYFDQADYGENYSGRRVACVFSRHGRALEGDGTLVTRTTPVYSLHFANNTATGWALMTWVVTGNAGKDLPYWERPGRYMFIDVTNY